MSTKMIWEGAISAEMVNGWTDEAIEAVQVALDEALDEVFCAHEQAEITANPLVRLVLEGYLSDNQNFRKSRRTATSCRVNPQADHYLSKEERTHQRGDRTDVGMVTHQQDRLAGLMLGYSKEEFDEILSGLCGIEAQPADVEAINKAIDFMQGIWAEGYFD